MKTEINPKEQRRIDSYEAFKLKFKNGEITEEELENWKDVIWPTIEGQERRNQIIRDYFVGNR
jgi:hypothetical protein